MEIVGVSAAGFAGADPARSPHMRIPLADASRSPNRRRIAHRPANTQWLHAFARLAPGFTAKSASAALQPLFHQSLRSGRRRARNFAKLSPYDRTLFFKRTLSVEIASTGFSNMRVQFSTALIVLMCMAGLILLVACSNVASLMVARAAARQKEIAVRLAIGAGRRALIRSLLVESLMLAGAGVILGLLLSEASIRALLAMMPSGNTLTMLHAQPDYAHSAFQRRRRRSPPACSSASRRRCKARASMFHPRSRMPRSSAAAAPPAPKDSGYRTGRALIPVARRRRPLRQNALQFEKHQHGDE